MNLSHEIATAAESMQIARLMNAAADHLTNIHGRGPWSPHSTQKGVLHSLRTARILIVREGIEIVATLSLATKKPLAIDPAYFTKARHPLYLTSMAVAPHRQRQGIGHLLCAQACNIARAWPGDTIRLDACDGLAGAGPFYKKCGFQEAGRVTCRNAPLIYFELML